MNKELFTIINYIVEQEELMEEYEAVTLNDEYVEMLDGGL